MNWKQVVYAILCTAYWRTKGDGARFILYTWYYKV